MNGETKGLRLQAYERLTLFCERINMMSLMMRLNNKEMTSDGLKNAMLISVQKEYEHNLTQQIYISNELWEMMNLLKNNVMAGITKSFTDHQNNPKADFTNAVMQLGQQIDATMGKQVRAAIRKEVELYFK